MIASKIKELLTNVDGTTDKLTDCLIKISIARNNNDVDNDDGDDKLDWKSQHGMVSGVFGQQVSMELI